MRIIITENQYKLLTEEEKVLSIPFAAFNNDWNDLQLFLERRGNPPYEITDDLDLSESDIKSLGNLTSVGGDLILYKSEIKSLGNLTSVGGDLDLWNSKIESFGNLTSVGGDLDLYKSEIKSLGNLTSVGGDLNLWNSKIESFGNLTSVEEIFSMVKVGGKIYL
jgi:hypothetical protein